MSIWADTPRLPLLVIDGEAAAGYLTAALILGAGQLVFAVRFCRHRTERSARWLLRATLVYLPLLLVALVLATRYGR